MLGRIRWNWSPFSASSGASASSSRSIGLFAVLVGLAVAFKLPSLESRKYDVGIATARVLVDTPSSQVVKVAPKGSDALGVRANLIANLMVEGDVKAAIAQKAGIAPDKLIGVPETAVGPPPDLGPTPAKANVLSDARSRPRPTAIACRSSKIEAQAPDAAAAESSPRPRSPDSARVSRLQGRRRAGAGRRAAPRERPRHAPGPRGGARSAHGLRPRRRRSSSSSPAAARCSPGSRSSVAGASPPQSSRRPTSTRSRSPPSTPCSPTRRSPTTPHAAACTTPYDHRGADDDNR